MYIYIGPSAKNRENESEAPSSVWLGLGAPRRRDSEHFGIFWKSCPRRLWAVKFMITISLRRPITNWRLCRSCVYSCHAKISTTSSITTTRWVSLQRTINFIVVVHWSTLPALHALQDLRNGRVSVCLSRRSTAAATCGWFAAELGRGQQISIDVCVRRVSVYRSISRAGARAAAASSVMFTAEIQGSKHIVVWPTMSCFGDRSERRHVTLSIIICSPLDGHPGWHNVTRVIL